jgi:hypothetical protein
MQSRNNRLLRNCAREATLISYSTRGQPVLFPFWCHRPTKPRCDHRGRLSRVQNGIRRVNFKLSRIYCTSMHYDVEQPSWADR